jgi:hypothetical protein
MLNIQTSIIAPPGAYNNSKEITMEYKTDITLYELGAQNWYVIANHRHLLNIDKYDLILDNEDEDEQIRLLDMHPVALASLARTCRNIAAQIARLNLED